MTPRLPPACSTARSWPASAAGTPASRRASIESTAPDGQYFGQVRLVPQRSGVSTCEVTAQNTSFNDTLVNLETMVSRNLRVAGATNAFTVNNRTVRKPNVTLAGGQPGVPSVDPGSLAEYIPLDQFGIAPIPIGDEEIINFNVPAFVFNGVTYSQLGVDSDGYPLAGGGTSEDNNCCNLPDGPDPARPNNMLAPFWTDLDGTGGDGILAAVVTDGVDDWLVIEYRVNVFGTTSERVFQVTSEVVVRRGGAMANPLR